MTAKKDFDIGDLVWAKMKCFPFWPAKIVEPPTSAKSVPKKARHYVFFFGSENCAWVQDENIVHHSEEMLQSASGKKKTNLLKVAIKQIIEEAPPNAEWLVKEKESPQKFPEASTSGTKRKISEVQRSPKSRKKVVPKRRAVDESVNKRTSPARVLSKMPTEDFPELINHTPPNLNYNRIAFFRSLVEQHPPPPTTTTHTSSGIKRLGYLELQPAPPLNLHEPNEVVLARKITPSDKEIGFIGLGVIGQRLVKNLLTTNHKVTVWNRTIEKCEDFAEIGAEVAQTPADLIEKCDIVFCCVSGPEASKNVVFGNCGILSGLQRSPHGSKGYVELTTLDPTTSIEISEAVTHKGGKYLEAPISGSRKMAEDGNLLIFSSGYAPMCTFCDSCFSSISRSVSYFGDEAGFGCKVNLIRNMLIGITQVALAEAMVLVEHCNLSQEHFMEIVKHGPLNSSLLAETGQAMRLCSFATNTSLKYQQRDLTSALSLDNNYGRSMVLTAAANEVFKCAKLRRYSDHDASAVYLGAKH